MAGDGALKKLAKIFDAFGKPPTLYYRGQAKIVTSTGCICTVFMFIVLTMSVVYDVLRMPDYELSSHETVVTDEDYVFNPMTENGL